MGGNGLNRPGGNLGFRIQGLEFRVGLRIQGQGFQASKYVEAWFWLL